MRNTICAALTAITLVLCVARGMRQCVQDVDPGPRHRRHRHHMLQNVQRQHQGMHRHTVRHEASGLRRLLGLPEGRPVMRLEPCERRGQGTTVKIWSQCGAVCIASEGDEERQACEIAVNALLRWSAEHDKEKEQQ